MISATKKDATKSVLLILLSLLYTDWMEHPICVTGRQQIAESVHCSEKLYIQSKSAPEDGRNCRPKHVQQA
jgi:hypothetical protein